MKIYKIVIKILVVLALFTPLFISTGTLFPFVFTKAMAFQILTELMMIVYLLGLVKFPAWRPRISALGVALGIFLTVLILSTVFSVDPLNSFWSKQERMEGLFNLLHYFAFFLVLTGVFRTKEEWLNLLKWSLAATALNCFYAVGQIFNLPGVIQTGVSGTLGNTSFLATYLVFNTFFALLLFFERSGSDGYREGGGPRLSVQGKSASRWIYLAVFLFFFVMLLYTGTRAAMYGELAGLVLFFGLFGFLRSSGRMKAAVVALVVLVVVLFALLFVFKDASWIKENRILGRITGISLKDPSLQQRFAGWRTGMAGFKARPALGWGLENYSIVFYKFMDPYFYGPTETFDRAHDKYIDLLVMTGILGLLAYLAIFVLLICRLCRILAKDRGNWPALWAFGLIAAYLIQNALLFDMPVSYVMFFLFLGFCNAYYFGPQSAAEQEKKPAGESGGSRGLSVFYDKILPVFNFVLIPALVFVIWWGNVKPFIVSTEMISALGSAPDFAKALDYSRDAFKSPGFIRDEGLNALVPNLIDKGKIEKGQANVDILAYASFLENELEKGLQESPLRYRYYLNLTNLYNFLGQADPGYFKKAEATARQGEEIYSRNIDLLFRVFNARMQLGDIGGSEAVLNEVLQKAPDSFIVHWYMALVRYSQKRYGEAEAEASRAVALGYSLNRVSNLVFLANIETNLNNPSKALAYIMRAQALAPDDPQLYADIASLYYQMGDKAKAREWALKILDVNPTLKGKVDEFLKTIGE